MAKPGASLSFIGNAFYHYCEGGCVRDYPQITPITPIQRSPGMNETETGAVARPLGRAPDILLTEKNGRPENTERPALFALQSIYLSLKVRAMESV